jgi:hypothetical protein
LKKEKEDGEEAVLYRWGGGKAAVCTCDHVMAEAYKTGWQAET